MRFSEWLADLSARSLSSAAETREIAADSWGSGFDTGYSNALIHVEQEFSVSDEWQDMSTAPADKEVLGFQATRGDHEDRMAVCWAIISDAGPFWMGAGGFMPTHWMPLPAPPHCSRGSADV